MQDEANNRYYAFIPQTTTHSKLLNSLQATTRWLYVVLAAERGSSNTFKATYKKLHRITGFSTSTIKRGIVELEQAGFLTYEHGGLRNPNWYDLEGSWLKLDRKPNQQRSRRKKV